MYKKVLLKTKAKIEKVRQKHDSSRHFPYQRTVKVTFVKCV